MEDKMVAKCIWKINSIYYCPLTGYCLNETEQDTILKKSLGNKINKLTWIQKHHVLMQNLHEETHIARQVQSRLRQKYVSDINKYSEYNSKKWIENCESFFTPDRFGAFIWISAVHIKLSEAEDEEIYSMIHTYSHKMFLELTETTQKLYTIKNEKATQTAKYNDIKIKLKNYKKENSYLKKTNVGLTSKLSNYINSQNNPQKINSNTDEMITGLENRIKEQNTIIENLKRSNKKLLNHQEKNESQLINLKNDFHKMLSTYNARNKTCEDCEKIDLCQKRVLIVGGLTKLQAFYRDLVTMLGGTFDYHEGTCKTNQLDLSQRISSSDIILCPVDVNSHAACLFVKKACKKSGKKYIMLRKSSISTIYSALINAACGC